MSEQYPLNGMDPFDLSSPAALNMDIGRRLSDLEEGEAGDVRSVFGRGGVVTAQAGDYTASKITNDSAVAGATVKDALETLNAKPAGATLAWVKDVENVVSGLYDTPANVVLTTTGAGDLQAAITALTAGQILEVKTNGVYSPIVLPAGKSFKVRAALGYYPVITGAGAVQIENGAADIVFSGFILENCTVFGNVNETGSCITFNEHQSIVNRIIFHNLSLRASAGSGVMLSYHWSVGADQYYAQPTLAELSAKIAFVSCRFFEACTDGNEGANLALRACKQVYVSRCYVNGGSVVASRGLQFQNCIDVLVEGCEVTSINGANGEAIKFDDVYPSTPKNFSITGMVIGCRVSHATQGIDIDDGCECGVIRCEVWKCAAEGIVLDGDATLNAGSKAIFADNVVHECVDGIRLEQNSIGRLSNNVSFRNTGLNYRVDVPNISVVDASNSEDFVDALREGLTGTPDLPASYTGQAGKVLAVKGTEDGMEFVTPGGGGGGAASTITYDNTVSKLTAANVQAAIDELKTLSNAQLLLKAVNPTTGAIIDTYNTGVRLMVPQEWANNEMPYFPRYLNGNFTGVKNILVATGTSGTSYPREIAEIDRITGKKVQSQLTNVGSKTRSICRYAAGVFFYPSGNDIRYINNDTWLGAADTVVATVASPADSLLISGNTLVCGCEDGVVRLYTISTGPVALVAAGVSPALGVQIRGMVLGDNQKLYVYASDAVIRVVDLANITAAPVTLTGAGDLAGTFVAEGIAYFNDGMSARYLIVTASAVGGSVHGIRVYQLTSDTAVGASDFYRSEVIGGGINTGLYPRAGNAAMVGMAVVNEGNGATSYYDGWHLYLAAQSVGYDATYPNLMKYRLLASWS